MNFWEMKDKLYMSKNVQVINLLRDFVDAKWENDLNDRQ